MSVVYPQKSVAPFGTWRSPVTPDMLVAGGLRFGGLIAQGGDCYWVEGRANEGGRNVIVRRTSSGEIVDITPEPFNVRTRVHEYGGGAFTVDDGDIWFVNFSDQAVYHVAAGQAPVLLTPASSLRFADLTVERERNRLLCVVEDHDRDGEPENALASIALDNGEVNLIARGHDFFSNPSVSPDGRRLAWLTWDHPRMPWDGTELWVAELDDMGLVLQAERVAGSDQVSVFQPTWSLTGELFFVADPTGWWNLYAWNGTEIREVHTAERELGRPQWGFGIRTFSFAADPQPTRVICTYCEHGSWSLGWIDLDDGVLRPVETELEDVGAFAVGAAQQLFIIAGAANRIAEVAQLDLGTGAITTIRKSSSLELTPESIAIAEPVEFPTSEGDTAFGYFYQPKNSNVRGPADERPPLIVIGHGGPTGATSASLSLSVQFWTSRGFAVLDVNYRGSTGYGRAYRDRLKGQWGVFDVADCVSGAKTMVARDLVDEKRLAIRGGSAGGYTALAALTFHDVFTAGASYYGISELEALARDTHKFEARYLDQLIGPYPEAQARYRERSPIHFTDRLSCPIIFFQGLEDKVVPPNQAEMMVAALRAKGLPVAYMPFEGEQHGFRAAATIKRTLEAELYFYGKIFGFEPADAIAPVTIEGLVKA